jgi:pimeloyl-ACP methyl ester carboxylesterase
VRIFRIISSTRRYPLDETWAREVSAQAYDIAHDPTAAQRQQAACKAGGDRRAELATITAPTLVVHGEDDPLQSVRAGRATAEAVPSARFLTFPDVAHGLPPAELWPPLLDEVCAIAAPAR